MTSSDSKAWNLQSFLDSFILELDKAQDTLSIKGVSRPLTYTVQDVALELQLFPQFDGETVRFANARPGEAGASKITLKFGSITDRQIREVTKTPITKDDVAIEMIDAIDEDTKQTLRKIGVTSGKDLERMEKRNIDLQRASNKKLDYQGLANLINQARRKQMAPKVDHVSVSKSDESSERVVLSIKGNNLAMASSSASEEFPLALLNDEKVEVVSATDREVRIAVKEDQLRGRAGQLQVALDPYSLLRVELKP